MKQKNRNNNANLGHQQAILFILIIFLTSCGNIKEKELESNKIVDLIHFFEFNPISVDNFELMTYHVDDAFIIDSIFILSAFSDGDSETSVTPINWGDRLILYKKDSIYFQSKPVGDVYLYEPHFYKNELNNRTIIICQLGYEYYFGGEVFILENGNIKFLGNIEIEGNNAETKLTDIVKITENKNSINFHFQSDSLVFKPGTEFISIKNNNLHYSYKNQKWQLNGLRKDQ